MQTSISLFGHELKLQYEVRGELVYWKLFSNPTREALLLETVLRIYCHQHIQQVLFEEHQARQYAEEQQAAARLAEDDIPF